MNSSTAIKTSHDLVVHLCGEQVIPIYAGLVLLPSSRHLLAMTETTEKVTEPLRNLPEFQVDTVRIEAYDSGPIEDTLRKVIGENPGKKIAFVLTGGTKLMFAVALSVGLTHGVECHYLDMANRKIIVFSEKGKIRKLDMPRVFRTVEEFILIKGNTIGRSGKWDSEQEGRLPLTRFLMNDLRKLRELIYKVETWRGSKNSFKTHLGFSLKVFDQGEIELEHHQLGLSARFLGKAHLCRYLLAEAFEEYCHSILARNLQSGEIHDLRIGLEAFNSEGKIEQELDLSYTDGYDLHLIECKCDKTTNPNKQKGLSVKFIDQLLKFNDVVRHFGGSFGRGIIVYPHRGRRNSPRLKSTQVCLAQGRDLDRQLSQHFISKRSGIDLSSLLIAKTGAEGS